MTGDLSILANWTRILPRHRHIIIRLLGVVILVTVLGMFARPAHVVPDIIGDNLSDQETWHEDPADPEPHSVYTVTHGMERYESTEDMTMNVTNVVNPHPFKFLLRPHRLCETGKDPVAIIFIPSRPNNFRTRDLIRNTWGNMKMFSRDIRIAFVIGISPESPGIQIALGAEATLFNDIIQEDFIDSYRNLSYKDICALKWVSTYCSNAHFVVKADDDLIVDTFTLIRVLNLFVAVAPDKQGLWCRVWPKMQVYREGKWGVNKTEYSAAYYPPYCSGMAYFMTPDVAKALYIASYTVPLFCFEDVYITGMVARHISLFPNDINQYFVLEPEYLLKRKNKFISQRDGYSSPIFSHTTTHFAMTRSVWKNIMDLEDYYNTLRRNNSHNVNKHESTTAAVKMSGVALLDARSKHSGFQSKIQKRRYHRKVSSYS